MTNNKVRVLGSMSGSSLDGLDIAVCTITRTDWLYSIDAAETIPFPAPLRQLLKTYSGSTDRNDTLEVSAQLAAFMGAEIQAFLSRHRLDNPDLIASHGHTLSHHPEAGHTLQIGNGQILADLTGLPVIWDFRMADIAAGGQGAPLVPICDELLFPQYQLCLNIGGIANVSMELDGRRIGFDICGANQLLNALAEEAGREFDERGSMAASGRVAESLLHQLNADDFFCLPPPRSLDNAYVQQNWVRVLKADDHSLPDRLRTATEHIALQIAQAMDLHQKKGRVLLTGGGAYNDLLTERIRALSRHHVSLPDDHIIRYKEALAMALMGALRWWEMPNFLPSVTGARSAVSGGVISYPTEQ